MIHSVSTRPALAAVALAAALLAQPAMAATKGSTNLGIVPFSAASGVQASQAASTLSTLSTFTFDVTGIFSVDEFGDADNETFTIGIGPFSQVVGIGWNVTLFADPPSWLSEMVVSLGSSTSPVVNLTPGFGDNGSGTASYSSGGIIDLVALELDFAVGADGILKLEFFEGFDDFTNDWDGRWESGTFTFEVSPIPEPSTYGLMALGLLAVAAAARRRAAR